MNEPHQHRQAAESFGSDAERYDRTRPRYPDALVDRIVAASPGPDVLDVGIGTGIAARQFQAAGCKVLGVEPDARMADLARRFGLEAEVAKFEDWDPAGRAFDAVIAAQAWHWIDPIAGAAKAAQALRPGGRLAVFWNAFQPPPEVAEAFSAVYRRVMPDSPISRLGMAGSDSYSVMCANGATAYLTLRPSPADSHRAEVTVSRSQGPSQRKAPMWRCTQSAKVRGGRPRIRSTWG